MTTMTTAHSGRPRLAHLLPIAAVAGLVLSLFNLVPAHAATWVSAVARSTRAPLVTCD